MKLTRVVAVTATVALLAVAAHSQVDGATYTGNRLCLVCHRANHAKIVTAYPKTAHARAILKPTDEVIKADFTNAPFTKDKITLVLATGRHEQAYLDADLKVLPGVWDVDAKKWLPHEPVDAVTECLGCHTTGFNPETRELKDSMFGVGCERCHGPASKHNTAKKEDRKSTIAIPSSFTPALQAASCGQCHSLGRSKDGKLAYPHGYRLNTDLAEVFTDARPTKPGRNQQYSEMLQSPKHWQAGVVCEKCHDPHGDTAQPYQLVLPINETCLQCHKTTVPSIEEHVKAKKHALPAGATCATCHMPDGRHLFDKTIVPQG
ncbi:MAG: hypothetical protein IT204_14650 [Fimbriimonadaceae bacterium]|nr:hypothetical protein [Fimbriimonadaceae bacterium]